ncbi:hypothetical protein ACP4OV_031750 [Aristida adscensionis]
MKKIFFHGGSFIVGSPGQPEYHRYVNSLVAGARVVAVSVGYRLAPEHLLPAAFDDGRAALRWAVSGAADAWLSDHGDPRRVFVAGASAGANIAHDVTATAIAGGERVQGMVLLHPSFGGEQKLREEDEAFWRSEQARWEVIFPSAIGGLDDPRINPMAAAAASPGGGARRLLVCTASEDPRAVRGRAYCAAVRGSGWRGKLEWLESEGEGHCFFLSNPGSRDALQLMDHVLAFLAAD